MNPARFVIGRETSEFLSVEVRQRTHPTTEDFWDGNWVTGRVEMKVGAFHGGFDGYFRTTEFEQFRDSLSRLHTSLEGTARFETMEDQLRVEIQGDGLGHLEAACSAMDQAGVGNLLKFALTLDQTELPDIIRGLSSIVSAFPTRGRPVG